MPADPFEEGRPGDRRAVPALLEQEREVREQRRRRQQGGDEDAPRRRQPHEQPERLGGDEEDGEVVRRDGERGDRRPGGEPAAAPAERPAEGEHRPGAEQREERVRAGFLRVPDEKGVHRDERCRDEAGAARHEHRPRAVGDRDRRRARERRE